MVFDFILPAAVFLMMLGLGLNLSVADFLRVAAYPRPIIAALVSLLIIVPLFAFIIVKFTSLTPVIALGVMLIATAPGGLFSNLVTHLGRGDLALSLSLTAIFTGIYAIAIPWVIEILGQELLHEVAAIDLPFEKVLYPLVFMTVLPVLVGMGAAQLWPELSKRIESPLRTGSSVFLYLVYAFVAYEQRDVLFESGFSIISIVVLVNVCALLTGFCVSRLSKLNREETVAVSVEHSIRQEGPAMFIAVTLLGSQEMALPLILNGGVGLPLAILFVYFLNRSKKPVH